jgi:transcriptional regulator with XRE-family HTH domain
VASALGIDRTQIVHYEAGRRLPSLSHALVLSDYLEVDLCWLFGRGMAPQAHSAEREEPMEPEKRTVDMSGQMLARLSKELLRLEADTAALVDCLLESNFTFPEDYPRRYQRYVEEFAPRFWLQDSAAALAQDGSRLVKNIPADHKSPVTPSETDSTE